MTGEGLAEWKRVAGELEAVGIATLIDRSLLAAYCQLWAEFVDGVKAKTPVSASHIARMQSLAAEFGIGPSSRSRLEVLPKKGPNDSESEFEAFKRKKAAAS